MILTIHFDVPGKRRKELAHAIADNIGATAQYKGAPSFAYEMEYFTLDKDGILEYDSAVDRETILALLAALTDQGFEYDHTDDDREIEMATDEPTGLCVSMPRSMFTDTAIANLEALIAAKGGLFKKALGVGELPIEVTDEKVSFPWFNSDWSPEEVKAYDTFICKLCEMVRTQKRITAKEKEVDNEKYAFRCFLLRLGFIGAEYKEARKILLRNLSGSSAFKGGTKASAKPAEEVADPFPAEEMVADALLIQEVNQSFDEEAAK